MVDRDGNRYVGDFVGQISCRAVLDNSLPANSSSESCPQATNFNSVTDVNGNLFSLADDTMGRPFHTFQAGQSSADLNYCVLSGLPFNSSITGTYAGANGISYPVKMCYATLNVVTAFGVSGVIEAQDKPGLTAPLTAAVLVTVVLPDSNNAISASSPKWVFNYDSYVNLTYIGLPTGGSISYSWQTLALGEPCAKISRVISSRTLNDSNGHSLYMELFLGTAAIRSSGSNVQPCHRSSAERHGPYFH